MKARSPRRLVLLSAVLAMSSGAACAEMVKPGPAPKLEKLLDLSLEELTQIDVTIASRGAERLDRTAAAVTVITAEKIRRTGATSIPEALRLVPGVVVARLASNQWAISCRFPDGRFSNKLLVLIDGRTAYSPLFSGTFWDSQDTLLEDVDRIEVIRGPGAAPWGSNAVAGVIHVITKSARDTRETLVSMAAGDHDGLIATGRHGWAVRGGAARVFGKHTRRDSFRFVDGTDAQDPWETARAGFRVDRTVSPGRELTLIGNAYAADERATEKFVSATFPFERVQVVPEDASGSSLTGRLAGTGRADGDWSLQLYLDHAEKEEALLGSRVSTFDLEYQRRLRRGRHELSFGLDYRIIQDHVSNGSPSVRFDPAGRQTYIAAAFIQGRWTGADDRWQVTAATRAEVNHFTGLELQPSVRGAWYPSKRAMAWTAASRAVRLPSRATEDTLVDVQTFPPGVVAPATPQTVLRFDGREVDAETVLDAEAGGRLMVSSDLHLDLTVFRGRYRGLLLGTPTGQTQLVLAAPASLIVFAEPVNRGRAVAQGVELAVQWTPRRDLRFGAGLAHASFREAADGGALDAESPGRLPRHTAHLRTEWDLARGWELDGVTYYSDSLPAPGIRSWFRTDLHLGYLAGGGTRLELVGQNLLDSKHVEFGPEQVGAPQPEAVPRSFYARVSRSF